MSESYKEAQMNLNVLLTIN